MWTPAALSSEAHRWRGEGWRVVEARHRVATLKLVDRLDEQAVLEALIEETKPAVPEECRHLDPLLAAPFRYGAPYPRGSRFRRAGLTPGVYYASRHVETAIAETAFGALRFYAESPATPWPANATEHTAFSAQLAFPRTIDLARAPLNRDRASWSDVSDYTACQTLADAARAADIGIIRYPSVRDPKHRPNLAVLTGRAFAAPAPVKHQTWRLRLGPYGVQALCEFPKATLEFTREAFAGDPRLRDMKWER